MKTIHKMTQKQINLILQFFIKLEPFIKNGTNFRIQSRREDYSLKNPLTKPGWAIIAEWNVKGKHQVSGIFLKDK